ncbi:hypothetical protein D3C75_892840 [compost metagenome]
MVLSQIITGRADQIAHIFNKQNIRFLQLKTGENLRHHPGVQMAAAACINLHRIDAQGADAVRILLRSQVTFHNPYPVTPVKLPDSRLQQRGFACAGGAHQIDSQHLMAPELLPDIRRCGIVVLQHILVQYNFHGRTGIFPV